MNREIKFRAWGRWGDWNETEDKRGWVMIDGDSLCFEEIEPISMLLSDIDDEAYYMQYTGLKDKNGVEIYEGDILQYTEHKNYLLPSCKMLICWDDEMAGFGYKMDSPHDFFWSFWNHDELKRDILNHCEVIGNVNQNPELLK